MCFSLIRPIKLFIWGTIATFLTNSSGQWVYSNDLLSTHGHTKSGPNSQMRPNHDLYIFMCLFVYVISMHFNSKNNLENEVLELLTKLNSQSARQDWVLEGKGKTSIQNSFFFFFSFYPKQSQALNICNKLKKICQLYMHVSAALFDFSIFLIFFFFLLAAQVGNFSLIMYKVSHGYLQVRGSIFHKELQVSQTIKELQVKALIWKQLIADLNLRASFIFVY